MGDVLGARRRKALDQTDTMPADLRACVHDFGLPVVLAFLAAGVRSTAHIRNCVSACWTQAQGSHNRQGGLAGNIDAMLIRQGGVVSAGMLAHLLKSQTAVILPTTPIPQMVEASIKETGRHGLLSKEAKHRVRLAAALRAGAAHYWPKEWRADA